MNKKLIIAALILGMFFLNLAIDVNAAACTDTDGGKNIYKKGVVNKRYTDYCMTPTTLREYYCSGAYPGSTKYTCNSCINGACKAPTQPTAVCGNAVKEGSEQCDNGANNGFACSPPYGSSCFYCSKDCKTTIVPGSFCGDGITNQPYEECDDKNTLINDGCESCKLKSLQYHFEYPEDKKNGFYALDVRDAQSDVYSCTGNTCKVNQGYEDLYGIKTGYTENFTYDSKYPIYGAWEIRDFSDFRNKCFVGDCNKANRRHVLCIQDDGSIVRQLSSCDKWTRTYAENNPLLLCIAGRKYSYTRFGFRDIGVCQKPKVVNFYYYWNNYQSESGYTPFEGYSSDWKSRWSQHFEKLKNYLSQYNISLVAEYYEYQIPDDSKLPSEIINGYLINKPGDVHVTIPAGKNDPYSYGKKCHATDSTGVNPCASYSNNFNIIRIPDYYDTQRQQGYLTLLHEAGHTLGCPHTGSENSLAALLYMDDIMSYGGNYETFKYECKLILWELGRNE